MRLMEEHTLRQPVMVSRLPKFGSRPPGGANLPVPKGSAIPSGPAAGAKALGAPRQNGIVQPPPTLSFRWKERVEPEESKGGAYRPQQQQQRAPITAREIKKPSAPVATTIRRSASSVSSTSHRTGHHPAPTRLAANHGLSNGLLTGPGHGSLSQSSDSLRLMPQDNMVRSQSFSHMTRVPGSGGAPITRSFSFNQELPRPNTRHTHPTQSPLTLPTTGLNGPRGSKMTGIARVQSAGTSLLAPTNLKKPLLPAPASNKPSALSYRLMRPSLIRQPRPMPIGRAQEETAKDLGQRGQREGSESVWDDTLVAPHPSSPTRSADSPTATPQELAELPPQARADEPRADDDLADTVTHDEARAEDSRVQDQTEHPESTVSQTRLDDLRKVDVTKEDSTPAELTEVNPELVKPKVEDARAVDICAESKTGAVDPSPTESDHDETSATSERVDLQESSPEKDGHAGPEGVEGLPVLCVTSVTGEPLEDMSLSSTSSLERSNDDTSEEYMDDFDNLGNGGGVLLLPPTHDEGLVQSEPLSEDTTHPSRQQDGCSITSLHSFLSESVDWGEMGLTGGKEAFSIPGGGVSSDGVFRDGSSLDLSPSDSSGATYMWDDEDGLEPLGGTIIPCHSYDSDLNSMDILNNLDNLDSCDLEEDDLMLDVDLPEDASLHSEADGRSHWRKMQLWSRQDHLHNNNNSRDDLQSLGSLDGDQVDHVCLDELTLQHMAQDCTSVKNQLLQLKQLLQVEETDCSDEGVSSSEAFTPDISEDRSCDEQVQELLMEVQKLREELRNKDKMIAQLTQQMSVPEESSRCSCHLKKPETQTGTRPLHQDGTTQTPWRGHAPQILPASGAMPCLNPHQSAIVAPSHTLTHTHTHTHTHSIPREGNSAATATASVRPQKPQSCPPSCPDPPPASELSVPRPRPRHRRPDGRRGKSRLAPHHRMERLHRGPSDQAEPLAPETDRDRDVTHTRTILPASAPVVTADRRGQRLRLQQQQPPPARGLPSFSSSAQACMLISVPTPLASRPIPVPSGSAVGNLGTGRSALVPPRGYRHNPSSPAHTPSCPARDLENGSSHTHTHTQTQTRTLVLPNSSHLPKPKRH